MNKAVLMLTFCLTISGVVFAEMAAVSIDVEAKPKRNLTEFNFLQIEDGKITTTPNVGVEPFEVITPLFSDYTEKYRYVWMPEGVSAKYHEKNVFEFPVGTVFIKSFSYLNDMRDPSKGERILETRLLIHNSKGWKGWVYLWNEEQTQASLKIAGTTVDAEWIDIDGNPMKNNYIVPNVNQCKGCHEQAEKMSPIGPKARYLNTDYSYAHGVQNQLGRWADVGYLEGLPADRELIEAVVAWDDASAPLGRRARAWLEMNCMHCHNPVGPASTTGFVLDYYEESPIKLGVMKPPVAAGRGSGGLLFDIVPGKPEESILLFRINSTDPGVMMPELPRRLVHKESSRLIRKWIEAMEMPEDINGN